MANNYLEGRTGEEKTGTAADFSDWEFYRRAYGHAVLKNPGVKEAVENPELKGVEKIIALMKAVEDPIEFQAIIHKRNPLNMPVNTEMPYLLDP